MTEMSSGASPTADAGQPFDLRVEFEQSPNNVEPSSPRFSWRSAPSSGNRRQSAYRILVARSPETLAKNVGDAWDSGKVSSGRSNNVPYDGAPLATDETFHWKVRCWNETDQASEYSEPATFSTAISENGFEGDWLSHQPGPGDSNGYRSRWKPSSDNRSEWVQVDLEAQRELDSFEVTPVDPIDKLTTPDGYKLTPLNSEEEFEKPPVPMDGAGGVGFPVRYRIDVSGDPDFDEYETVVDKTDEDQPNPGTDTQSFDIGRTSAQYVRVTATEPYTLDPETPAAGVQYKHEQIPDEFGKWKLFALASLAVRDGDCNDLARGRPVTASSSAESETWGRQKIVDGAYESSMASSSPQLRTELELTKPVKGARLHVAHLGYGEVYINGERIGQARLDPGWTQYGKQILYTSYDVEDELQEGDNAIGVWLGRGWFSKSFYSWTSYGSPRLKLQLTVEYEDGTTTKLLSDSSWRATGSPILENDVYDGEYYDARQEHAGWSRPGFDDGVWDFATAIADPGGKLTPQRLEPIQVTEEFEPESVREMDGEYVVDFGQNMAGWVELSITGANEGDEIEIAHAEALTDDGDLSMIDLRTADATDAYVARGDGTEVYEPRFTYHGFRYAKVCNYPGEFEATDIRAKAVHTGMDKVGTFECSSETVNKIQYAAEWTQRSNSMSVPTDCPQRDERAGWGGDTPNSARAWMFNFDAVRFFEKWMRDHEDEQSPHGYLSASYPHMFGTKPADPSWPLTRVVFPWYLYLHYGDDQVMREHYEGIRRYIEYWESRTDGHLLPTDEGFLGDWLSFENTDGNRGLPIKFFNNTTHYLQTSLLGEIAGALDFATDAERYRARADAIAKALNDEFFDAESERYEPGTQASYALPLFLDIVPEGHEDGVLQNLVTKIRTEDEQKLKTGFLSTRPLIHTLADRGYADLAYNIITQPEVPSWGYMIRNGATTMWEHWDSDQQVGTGMNSLNHHQFSLVSEWFYRVLAGINLDESAPGYEHVEIAPAAVDALDWAEGSVQTPYGKLSSRWEQTEEEFVLSITIPWNTTADIRLPTPTEETNRVSVNDEIVWSGKPGSFPGGVKDISDGDELALEVAAGEYELRIATLT